MKIGWQIMQGSIMRIRDVCKERNIELTIILFPDKINVLKEFTTFSPEGKSALKGNPGIPVNSNLSARLVGLCLQLDVKFIDFQNLFYQSAKNGVNPYLPMDTHLSKEGHQIVAEVLRDSL